MKLQNKKSGFTLLEIIIVIIIVGVLASLALPRFFSTIEYARSTEALNAIGSLKRGADRCAMAQEAVDGTLDYSGCGTWGELATSNPSNNSCVDANGNGSVAGGLFEYTVTPPAAAQGNWVVAAERVDDTCTALALPGGGVITFTYNTSTGTATRAGTGAYGALK